MQQETVVVNDHDCVSPSCYIVYNPFWVKHNNRDEGYIHYNCTRQFLVALVFADLPSLFPFILRNVFILVPLIVLS